MDIRHTDKDGNPWAFSIDCTPYQCEIFERAFVSVRNVGNRDKLTMRYYADYEANERFCRGVERAILSGLAAMFPPAVHKEPRHQGHQAPPPPTFSKMETTTDTDPTEENNPTYYWENF